MRVERISGPVSVFGLEVRMQNRSETKKVYLLGDIHLGKQHQCPQCDIETHCYGLVDLIENVFKKPGITDFYLETSYLPKHTLPKDIALLYKRDTNFLEHLRKRYKDCFVPYRRDLVKLSKDTSILNDPESLAALKRSKECFTKFPNVRFHYTDLRLDPDNPIGQNIDHLVFRKSRNLQTTLEKVSDDFQKYLSPGLQVLTSTVVSLFEIFHWIFFQQERNFKKDGLHIFENLAIYSDVLIYSDNIRHDLQRYNCRPPKENNSFVVKTGRGSVTRIRKAILKLKPSVRKVVTEFYEHRKRLLLGVELPIVPMDDGKRPVVPLDMFTLLMDIYLICRLLSFLDLGKAENRDFLPGQQAIVYAGDWHVWNYREFFAYASRYSNVLKVRTLFSSPRESAISGPFSSTFYQKTLLPSRCKHIGVVKF